jgi:hypothetical protein
LTGKSDDTGEVAVGEERDEADAEEEPDADAQY